MRLYFDLGSGRLVERAGFTTRLREVEFKRGDSSVLEVGFYREGLVVDLEEAEGAVTEMVFAVKTGVAEDAALLLLANDFTQDEETLHWRAPLLANLETLTTLLGDERVINGLAEMTWRTASSGPTSSQTLTARIHNDVWKGTEGTPLELPEPEGWLDARALRHDAAQGLPLAAQRQARRNARAAAEVRELPPIFWDPTAEPTLLYTVGQNDVGKRLIVPGGWLGGITVFLDAFDAMEEGIGYPGDVFAVDFSDADINDSFYLSRQAVSIQLRKGIHFFRRREEDWEYIGNNYEVPFFPAPASEVAALDAAAVKTSGAQNIAGQKTFTTAPRSTGTPDADTSLLNRAQGDLRYGMQMVVIAPSNLSKTSDAALANDPNLQLELPAGRWLVEAVVLATINFSCQISHTGTSVSGSGGVSLIARTSNGNVLVQGSSYVNTTSQGNATNDGGAYWSFVHAHNAESTLAVRWAQHTSSGTPTTRHAGSVLRATYLGPF